MIGDNAFTENTALHTINLPESLLGIGSASFRMCQSLTAIHIPKSVFVIGVDAFSECLNLEEVTLCEGGNLGVICARAFYDCPKLKKISIHLNRTVPTGDSVGIREQTFRACKSLTEVHLFEGVEDIDEEAFRDCISLLRINIPSTVNCIDEAAFGNCSLLRNVAISADATLARGKGWRMVASIFFRELHFCTLEKLRCRFDDLPLHEACFYRSSSEYDDTMAWLSDISADYSTVDCLGMTPLHVLACSGTHDLRIYQHVVDSYPDALVATDKWGDVPLTYVMLSDAPTEVLLYCLERHKQEWGTMPFDFAAMIIRLVKFQSESCIRKIIQAQRTVFPELEVNWKGIVDESKSTECKVSIRAFRALVEAFASPRTIGLRPEHQLESDDHIDMLNNIYFDEPFMPYMYISEGHSDRFTDRLIALKEEETPLDIDRLVGFDEDYRVGLLDEMQKLTMKYAQLRDNLLTGVGTQEGNIE